MAFLFKLKHELKEVALVTLYFFFCFSVLLILKKLWLADYQIEITVLSKAVISALIVAKVVIVLEKTRAATRFDDTHSLVMIASYKTLNYAFATFIVLLVENLFHVYHQHNGFVQGVIQAWQEKNINEIMATLVIISLTFFAYHLYTGLGRRLGKDTLWQAVTVAPKISGLNGDISLNKTKGKNMSYEILDIDNEIVCIRVIGEMKLADQLEFQKLARNMIEQKMHPKVLVITDDFQGWEKAEGWDDVSFLMDYGDEIAKMAIVTEEKWQEQISLFVAKDLRKTQIEFFPPSALQEAEAWLRA